MEKRVIIYLHLLKKKEEKLDILVGNSKCWAYHHLKRNKIVMSVLERAVWIGCATLMQ
jgi:hypothetical protein